MNDDHEPIPEPAESDRVIRPYRDAAGKYRWRLVAKRGNLPDEVLADSGQGYALSRSAKKMAESLFPGVPFEYEDGKTK